MKKQLRIRTQNVVWERIVVTIRFHLQFSVLEDKTVLRFSVIVKPCGNVCFRLNFDTWCVNSWLCKQVFVLESTSIFRISFQLAKDLLHPSLEEEKRQHKKKRLVQSPNSYFMDVKCPGCYKITTVFSHAQTVVLCVGCSTVLCQPTGGKARLTEGRWGMS
ncbi:RS27L protein, partial [Amia calva]|nr:RS27L protein [Amia calva]